MPRFERELTQDIKAFVSKATGWEPIKVYQQEGNYIPIAMPDGAQLYIKVNARGDFLRVVAHTVEDEERYEAMRDGII